MGEELKACSLYDCADVADAIGPTLGLFVKQAAPVVQKVADEVYERLLFSVQDYLKENAEWNIGGEIERCTKIKAENVQIQANLADLAEAARGAVEALRSTPIIGRTENAEAFACRQNGWLMRVYEPALATLTAALGGSAQ